ncbi:unnamed protein product [Allacma fusca]|uniref:Rabenosyn-5 n=1 Tax=Allacma fusca TaxID=39272 RepID=A0A8J2LIY0_9HEXA|nr:unnamed protein product [Allacma fusca]
MSDAERGIIREGFICADCLATFTGADELLKHYENVHGQGTIKAFLGKAKQKFTKDIQQTITTNPFLQSSSATLPPVAITYGQEPQLLGVMRSHYDVFKRDRKVKIERYASEGNKLLIRLMKLCDGIPDDPSKRKAHEQSIVNWMDEKSVSRCPDCTSSFNVLLKRKHHCRLCGSVLCDECSKFMLLSEAKDLTKSLRNTSATVEFPNSDKKRHSTSPVHLPKREEITFRCCSYCYNIMENRKSNNEVQESGKKLIADHNNLKETLNQAEQLIPDLVKIVDSLNSGESLHSVQQANEEKYLNELKTKSREGTQVKKPVIAQVGSEGWVSEVKNVEMVDDPIQQQINNLEGFIEQAKLANKLDEVETLEKSLKEWRALK